MPRLLIVCPTFFPDPNVSSVRVSQWAKWLPDFGWTPQVVTRHTGYESTLEELAKATHPDARVTRLGPRREAPDSRAAGGAPRGGWKGATRQLLEQVLLPDATIVHWRAIEADALRIAKEFDPDVVLSSSSPASVHWLGRRVAKQVNAKWVADFRDPITLDQRFSPRGLLRPLVAFHRRFEGGIYRDADLTLHLTPLLARWARLAYPAGRSRVRVLENGVSVLPPSDAGLREEKPTVLRVCAVGHIAPDAPALLYESMKKLRNEGLGMRFEHVGAVPPTVESLPADAAQHLRFRGRVPHAEAMQVVQEADLLVAYLAEERSHVIGVSTKLYEYFGVGKPILVVNPTRPDRQLIRQAPWCMSLRSPSSEELAEALRKLAQPGIQPDPEQWRPLAEKYHRRVQTEQLAGWLDQLIQ